MAQSYKKSKKEGEKQPQRRADTQEHETPRARRKDGKRKFESNLGGSRPLLIGIGIPIMCNQDRLKKKN